MIKEGYLTKVGGRNKTWKKRWFILQDNLMYYFATRKDMVSKGCILFSKINAVEKAGPEVKKKNCFQVVTSERTYLIYSEDERDMKEWMRAIESLSELHKSRDKWEGRGKYSAVDGYRHDVVTITKKILQNVIKVTAITKSLAEKAKKDLINEIAAENNTAGALGVRLSGDCLVAAQNAFDKSIQDELKKGVSTLRESVGKLAHFGKGTANEAALEQTIKIALEEIDKLINLETPKQTKEIANAIESVVMEVGRFLESPDSDSRIELGKKVGKAAEEFVSTCANVASMISDSQLASAVIAKARELPSLADQMRESGKNAKMFAGDDAYVSDVVDIKNDMDTIFDGVIALIQRAFGENIQVKRFRDTTDMLVVQGFTGNLNSSQRNTVSNNNGSPYTSQQFHHSPYASGVPNNGSPYASQQFNHSPYTSGVPNNGSPYGTPKQPTVLSTPPQQIIPPQPQQIQTMAPSTPTQQQYMPVQQQPNQPQYQPQQPQPEPVQPAPEPVKLYNFGQEDNVANPDMPDLDNIDDIGSLIPQIRI
jgi:hypothetical protein